jgi:hypothetical protein
MKKEYLDLLYMGKPLEQKKVVKKQSENKVIIPTEHEEQSKLHQWLSYRNVNHAAIPNANAMSFLNKNVAIRVTNKLKAEGMSPGFPDLIVFANKYLLIIEMKRLKGGVLSEQQKEWKNIISNYNYCKHFVCNGADEAIKEIQKWI